MTHINRILLSNQLKTNSPSLVLDLKKNRIRIHTGTLYQLGSPDYIQILMNPDSQTIALLPSLSKDYLAHKIPWSAIEGNSSFELYSKSLISQIRTLCHSMECGQVYRIKGKYVHDKNVILFSMRAPVLITMEASEVAHG